MEQKQSYDLERLGAGRENSITTNQRTSVSWENLYQEVTIEEKKTE